MKQIVLDTETTGLDPAGGDRIIEIGCVAMEGRKVTGEHYHVYLQPDREVPEEAIAVHGITNGFLTDKPRFADEAARFVEFVQGTELVIHNAAFDVGFINHEFKLLAQAGGPDFGRLEDHCQIVDSLAIARKRFPGARVSLDALCKKFDIDNSRRTLHGALLDSEILADVYLMLTGGQTALTLEMQQGNQQSGGLDIGQVDLSKLRVHQASQAEQALHEAYLDQLQEKAGVVVWRQ
ncbi:DNA polymerase III subunit epsilon [Salinibius halmophilus]|uniref:DNA polymerase III subunit epsilon n=1 Tax=Salinibius halmophilus TaxID=1853216 RepID=UPI000E665CD7|nr:DNA polymerase III subunit epsilon [Salinibius halmophilus]